MLTSLLNVSTIYIMKERIISYSTDEISDKDMRKTVDIIQDTFLITQENNTKYTLKKYFKDEG